MCRYPVLFPLLLSVDAKFQQRKAIIPYFSLFSQIKIVSQESHRSISFHCKVFRYCHHTIALDNRHWWWFLPSLTMTKRRQQCKRHRNAAMNWCNNWIWCLLECGGCTARYSITSSTNIKGMQSINTHNSNCKRTSNNSSKRDEVRELALWKWLYCFYRN